MRRFIAIFIAILIAASLAAMAATILGVLIGILSGAGHEGGSLAADIMLILAVPFFIAFAWGARPRLALRRGLLAIGLEMFLIPLVGVVSVVTIGMRARAELGHPASTAMLLGTGSAILGIGIVLVIAVGIPALVLYFALRREPQESRQAS